MTFKSQLGKSGEDAACDFLIKNGYKIIERNFRKPWGELDIIAKAPDRTLVFIEVKTVSGRDHDDDNNNDNDDDDGSIKSEEQLTRAKLQKLKKAASLYAGHYPELIKDDKGWRIDLVALEIFGKQTSLRHYKNIV